MKKKKTIKKEKDVPSLSEEDIEKEKQLLSEKLGNLNNPQKVPILRERNRLLGGKSLPELPSHMPKQNIIQNTTEPKTAINQKHHHHLNKSEKQSTNIKKSENQEKTLMQKKIGVLEKYEINVDGAKVEVSIIRNDLGVYYNLFVPKIDLATSMLLDDVRHDLISLTNITMKELINPEFFESIKKRLDDQRAGL